MFEKIRVTWHSLNSNNFRPSAALVEVCALLSVILVLVFILKSCSGRHSGNHKNVVYYYLIYLILSLTTADADAG